MVVILLVCPMKTNQKAVPPKKRHTHVAVGQNPVPLVNIKIGRKWMFIHPKMEPKVMPHGHVKPKVDNDSLLEQAFLLSARNFQVRETMVKLWCPKEAILGATMTLPLQ